MLVLGLLGYFSLRAAMKRTEAVERAFRVEQAIYELRSVMLRAIMPANDYLITGAPAEREHFVRLAAEVEERFATLRGLIGAGDVEEIYGLWQQTRSLSEYILAIEDPRRSTEGPALMRQMDALAYELTSELEGLQRQYAQQVIATESAAHTAWNRAGLVLLAGLVVFILGGLVFAWRFSAALAHPLMDLTRSAEALARGNLDIRVHIEGNDEIARLSQAFNHMAASLQHKIEEQEAIARIVQDLNASYDVSQAFRAIADDLQGLVHFERASVALIDDPEQPAYFTVHVIVDDGDTVLCTEQTLSMSESAAAHDILIGRPHRTDDLSTEQEYPVEQMLYEAGYRSRLSLPLIVESRVIGSLNLASTRPAAFANVSLAALEQVAAALAAALNQARLQQQLETSLQRRTAEAHALNAIAASAVSASDLKEVLRTALDKLLPVLNLEAGGVYLPCPDNPHELHLVAYKGISSSFAEAVARLSADTGFTGQVYCNGEPVVLEDIAAHAPQHTLPIVAEHGWRAFAAVPLRFGENILGVLGVSSHERRYLSADDLSFLQAAADQLGSAVENARLRRELQRHLSQVQTLAAFTEKLNTLLDRDAILEAALQQIVTIVDVDGAEVHLVDEHGTLSLAGAWGLESTFVKASQDYRFAVGEGLPGKAFAVRAPVYVEDASSDARYLRRELARRLGYKSLLCIPILGHETVLGTFMLYTRKPRKFTPAEHSLLMAIGAQIAAALERSQLHEQVKAQRIEEQETLLRLSQALLGEVEMGRVMDETVRVAAEALKTEFATIALIEEDGEHYSGWAGVGWPQEIIQQARHIPLTSNTGVAHAIRTGKPLVIRDTREEDRFEIPPWVAEMGIVSALIVPMVVKERPIGALVVNSRAGRDWSQDEVRLLSLIANQAAQALEGARLYAEARERLERITALHEIDVAITSRLHLQETLDVLLEKVTERLKVNAAAIALVHPDTKELRYVARRGLDRTFFVDRLLNAEDGVAGQAARSGHPIAIPDMREHPQFVRRSIARQLGLASYLAVPLRVRGETIGVLELVTRECRTFTPEETNFFMTLAGQAAIVIDNTRLFETTLRRAEELTGLYQLSLDLADVVEPELVCQKVTAAAARALDIPLCLLAEFDREEGEVRGLAPAYGLPDEVARAIAYRVDQQIVNLWDISKTPYLILSDTSVLPAPLREIAERAGARSLLAARVVAAGQPVGILFAAEMARKHSFNEDDARLLAAYAQQAAIALARARAYQMAQQRLQELEQAYKVVQEALQLRDDMIRNVSHELRTPLTTIRGYLELLLDGFLGDLDPDQMKAVEVMHKNSERLRFMVERLLTLQSLRAKEVQRERIPVCSWLQDVAARWQPKFRERNVSLVLKVEEKVSHVLGERELLDQVMDNLIHNALKFSPDGRTVWLQAWETTNKVVLAVRDQGIGIPPEKVNRVFEKFYQVDASPTRRFEGMGIGLALVKEIVERHGGRVWAESEGEGMGSTFYVALPIG